MQGVGFSEWLGQEWMNSGNGKFRDWCIQVARLPQCLCVAHPLRDDQGDVEGPLKPPGGRQGVAGGG